MRHADEMNRREIFHETCGYVLAHLDDEFPTPVTLSAIRVLTALEIEQGKHGRRVCGESIQWLADNGYIKIDGRHSIVDKPLNGSEMGFTNARLADKGFSALNIQLEFRGEKKRAGDALSNHFREVAGDARAAVVSKIVDQITAYGGNVLAGLVG